MLKELRKNLNDNAELSNCEYRTMQILTEFLTKNTSIEIVPEDGWFYAVHKEGESLPTIAVRADMDGIKNSCGKTYHGCGHDGHSTILAGLALTLEHKSIGKNVMLIFQPAEETGEGALKVLNVIFGKDIQVIYGFHNIPGYEEGRMLVRTGCFSCASKGFTVKVTGRQSHAAYPDQGANPSNLLCNIVCNLPDIIKNITNNEQERLLMATVVNLSIGEKNFGISAGEGELSITLRAYRDEDMLELQNNIQTYCRTECEKNNMIYEFIEQDVFPDTVNSDQIYTKSINILKKHRIDFEELKEPMRWSEDFGWYLKEIPGMYFGIGAGSNSHALHTDDFEFNDSIVEGTIETLINLITEL